MSDLILGWDDGDEPSGYGFTGDRRPAARPEPALVRDASDAHMICISGTGGGKGRSVAIPNLLHWDGPAIVLDIKGELYATTSRYRRSVLGQDVVLLDPWGIARAPSGALNPLDVLTNGPELADECYKLASMLAPPAGGLDEPFWYERGESFIAGGMAFLATDEKDTSRATSRLFEMLHGSDTIYNIAVQLDLTGSKMHPFAYSQLSALCQTADKTREGIVSTAQSMVRVFGGELIRKATASTSFDLQAITDGKPMTIYMVVPPANLISHASLIRLWLSCLLSLITKRQTRPEKPTLFLLDEMAQLGPMEQVKTAITLTRGYGVRCALFLQSYSQLVGLYPRDHRTLLENCGTLVTMGHTSRTMSVAVAEALGDINADRLYRMPVGQTAIKTPGHDTRLVRKLDYLTDPLFRGRYDANPLYRRSEGVAR